MIHADRSRARFDPIVAALSIVPLVTALACGGDASHGPGAGGSGGSGGGRGGSSGSSGGSGGTTGGTTLDGSTADVPAADAGADSDAAPCTDQGFDCPEYFACDQVTRRCTTQCSSAQPCHGGCCAAGSCQPGVAADACGRDGLQCRGCANAPEGSKCLVYPDQDSPSRPGGYCGCGAGADCPVAPRTTCAPKNNLELCCTPTNAACSSAAACCSGVCGGNVCG